MGLVYDVLNARGTKTAAGDFGFECRSFVVAGMTSVTASLMQGGFTANNCTLQQIVDHTSRLTAELIRKGLIDGSAST